MTAVSSALRVGRERTTMLLAGLWGAVGASALLFGALIALAPSMHAGWSRATSGGSPV